MSHVRVKLSQSLHSVIHKSSLVRFHIKSSTSQVTSKSASSHSSIKSGQILRRHSYVKSGQSVLCHSSQVQSNFTLSLVVRSGQPPRRRPLCCPHLHIAQALEVTKNSSVPITIISYRPKLQKALYCACGCTAAWHDTRSLVKV